VSFGVGENQTDNQKCEGTKFERRQGPTEIYVTGQKNCAGEEFYGEVTGRYARLATAATPEQHQPAEHGKVIVKRNLGVTMRASGPGFYDG
jgi:hypothetical protein